MAVIGIDLGTTYCAAAVLKNGDPQIIDLDGEATMPSVVGLQANGKIAVGRIAKRNQAKAPQNTIIEVKRKMGENVQVALGETQHTPQDISAMLLKKIVEYAEGNLGESIKGVVISCPAYFQDPERQATKEAGDIAGLNVLKIINEPTAAAYAYGVTQDTSEGEKLFVVYDLGGGTFDVTVIRMAANLLKVLGTGGDPHLGGGDFDDRIVGWMMEDLAKRPGYVASLTDDKRNALKLRLKSYAEEGKKALCTSSDANPSHKFQIPKVDIFEGKPIAFNETLTMEKFEELIADLMEGSLKWIDEALKAPKKKHKYSEDDITAVLLVGGSTRVPLVQRILKKRFPNTPIRGQESGIDPDQIVALGAAIVAGDVDPDSGEVAKTTLVDVTGHTLSVAALNERRGREELVAIIPKETPIPYDATYDFVSQGRGQRQCRIRVFQGEGTEIDLDKVTMIGEFLVEIAPIEQPTPLRIGLDLDANGILLAHATDKVSGQRVECKINYEDSAQITPAELEQKRKALDAQLNAVLRPAANPLDGGQPAGQSAQNVWAPMPPPPGTATAQPPDTTSLMNPIMRNLYQKAINNFNKVPADRQAALVQLTTEIETVARSGDQDKLMSYFSPLQQLLEGVE